jgi:hypothetical protein
MSGFDVVRAERWFRWFLLTLLAIMVILGIAKCVSHHRMRAAGAFSRDV